MQNDVLFSMLMRLLAAPRTAPELAARHELSVRSVYRYLDTLESAGIPLMRKSGRNGGFYIDSAHFIDKAYFTDEEYKLLLGLTEGARLGGSVADSVADKIAALARMHGSERYRISPDTLVIDADSWTGGGRGAIAEFQRAIENKTAMEIEYTDASNATTSRLVQPHTLVLKAGAWYVYAYCTLRDDWRLFALSRIRVCRPAGTFRRKRYELNAVPWRTLPSEDARPVTVTATPEARVTLSDRYRTTANADGTLTILAPATPGFRSELLRFGSDVTVLSPPEFRESIRVQLSAALARYDETSS